MFRLATSLVCVLSSISAVANCAPDYRTNKNSGLFIQEYVITGTSSLDSGTLQRIRSKLVGACVDEDTGDLEFLLKEPFQNEGYHNVAVKNLDIQTIDPLARPKNIRVEAEISEGQVFRLGQVSFVGNHAFSSAEIRKASLFRKGQIFGRNAVAGGLYDIRKMYVAKGFGDLTLIPDDTNEDLGSSTVNFTITVEEGPQYHMGKLIVVGKQDDRAARLQSAWHISEGAVFDFEYPEQYIKANRKLLTSNFNPNDLRVVRNCPEATVSVWLILDEAALMLSPSQPIEVKCEEQHDDSP